MINWFHSRIHRPEKGWDPVPDSHVAQYAAGEWFYGAQDELTDILDGWCGGLAGKSILDLGGGPGQYAVAFARRGARVTWYDVSNRYRELAEAKAREHGVTIQFAIGYLDEAADILDQKFDLVFNRICWYYGRGDASFSRVLYDLVKPGGVGYVDTTHDGYKYETLSMLARLRVGLNKYTGWKIGHPYPPHGRLARLFMRYPLEKILVEYSAPMNDQILFKKPLTTGSKQ